LSGYCIEKRKGAFTVSIENLRCQEGVDDKSEKQKAGGNEEQIRVNGMSQLIGFIQVEVLGETAQSLHRTLLILILRLVKDKKLTALVTCHQPIK
jgi:hypothetical protein